MHSAKFGKYSVLYPDNPRFWLQVSDCLLLCHLKSKNLRKRYTYFRDLCSQLSDPFDILRRSKALFFLQYDLNLGVF